MGADEMHEVEVKFMMIEFSIGHLGYLGYLGDI